MKKYEKDLKKKKVQHASFTEHERKGLKSVSTKSVKKSTKKSVDGSEISFYCSFHFSGRSVTVTRLQPLRLAVFNFEQDCIRAETPISVTRQQPPKLIVRR